MLGIDVLPERVRARIRVMDNGCWEWTGDRRPGGYGRIWLGRRVVDSTHRYVYKLLVGPISEGLVLDHLCCNRICCNPAHLEPVTPGVNNARGLSPSAHNALKTHCDHGHEFTPENTGIDGRGDRYCKACRRHWAHVYYPARYEKFRAKHPLKNHIARCSRGHELIGENLRITPAGKKKCWTCTREGEARRVAAQDREWQLWLGLDHAPTEAERLAKFAELETTHCPAGHEYTLENTVIHRRRRHCRTCHAATEARRRSTNRENKA